MNIYIFYISLFYKPVVYRYYPLPKCPLQNACNYVKPSSSPHPIPPSPLFFKSHKIATSQNAVYFSC